MSTSLIFNTEPRPAPKVKTGLEYRVDARTRREPKRVWTDVPTYKSWLGKRKDDALNREGYKAFKRENLSQQQQDEFYKLMDNVHRLLHERARIDAEYSKALTALAAFGPVPPQFEMQISAKVREALKLRKLDGRPDLEDKA
jgi:hypothetical protein